MEKKTWNGWIQYNTEGVSIFRHLEFAVSEEMYQQIQEVIATGKRLSSCEFYQELRQKLIDAFDTSKYEDEDERPVPEDYNDEEEYEEALQEYEDEREDFEDRYFLVDSTVYDPADEREFKTKFIGKQSPVLKQKSGSEYEYQMSEDYDRRVETYLTVEYDSDGMITDICDICAEGLESEGVNSSRWGDARPNYDLLADELAEELEIEL